MVGGEWMPAVDQFDQPCGIDVGIDLGSRNVGMTEQRLQDTQVRSSSQQVGRERVPQHMRADAVGGDPGQCRHAANQLEQANAAEV